MENINWTTTCVAITATSLDSDTSDHLHRCRADDNEYKHTVLNNAPTIETGPSNEAVVDYSDLTYSPVIDMVRILGLGTAA